MTKKEANEPNHVMLDRIEWARLQPQHKKKRPNESRQFVADRCHLCGTPGPNEDQDRFALQAIGRIYKDAWFPGRHLNISEF